jgi:phosphatidylglycerophosphatase A
MNISTEFMLLCFGFNVNKLHSKTVNNKRGFKIYKEELLKQAVWKNWNPIALLCAAINSKSSSQAG